VAPGQLPAHYAPRTPLHLVVGADARRRLGRELRAAVQSGRRVGALLVDEDRELLPAGATVAALGAEADPAALAAHLFDGLRALDRAGLDVLYARAPADPRRGLGRALADRLRRAAARVIDT
jgi:L-threonylcarbamoyladenylate synthase